MDLIPVFLFLFFFVMIYVYINEEKIKKLK